MPKNLQKCSNIPIYNKQKVLFSDSFPGIELGCLLLSKVVLIERLDYG